MKNLKKIGLLLLALALLMAALPLSALAESYLEATGGRVNVRSGPGVNYSDLYTLVRGEKVEYTGEYAYDNSGVKWYKVQYYSYGTGWVSSAFSKVSGSGSSTSSSGTSVSGSYVKASGGNVNIRQTPNLNGEDLGTMKEGQTASYLNQSSTDDRGVVWYYVNFNGTIGWVSSRYSKLYGGSTSSSGSTDSGSSASGYVIASGDVNVRQSPSLNGKDLGTMKEGQTASYLGQSSTDDRGVVWYYVNFNGITGWVSSRYAKLGGSSSSVSASNRKVVATDGQTNIRSEGNLYGKVLKTLPKGASATYLNSSTVDERGVTWYKVSYDGTTGWVSSRYTTLK